MEPLEAVGARPRPPRGADRLPTQGTERGGDIGHTLDDTARTHPREATAAAFPDEIDERIAADERAAARLRQPMPSDQVVDRVGERQRAASQVVRGTEATRPMLPTRVRTISVATTSPLATAPSDWPLRTNSTSSGIEAPA